VEIELGKKIVTGQIPEEGTVQLSVVGGKLTVEGK